MKEKIRIGITKSKTNYDNYPTWIKDGGANIEIIELDWLQHAKEEVWDKVEDCDGIVLTGGVDIHPFFYDGALQYANQPREWCKERDEFEMHVFETALNFNLPVLAICRGLQLVNVALGGDLIQDLEETGKKNHRRMNDIDDEHGISIIAGSLLSEVVGGTTGTINGAHHQAAGHISDELIATATSADGVIEALEWKDKADEPWLLAVQWHPERMNDRETNPTSKNIREAFLRAAKAGI